MKSVYNSKFLLNSSLLVYIYITHTPGITVVATIAAVAI